MPSAAPISPIIMNQARGKRSTSQPMKGWTGMSMKLVSEVKNPTSVRLRDILSMSRGQRGISVA